MASFADISIRFSMDLKKFSSDMQNVQRDLNRVGKNLQNVGANLTAGVSLPLLGLGALAVDAAADFETLNTSLKTAFEGNEAAAQSAFDEISKFSTELPVQIDSALESFIKLKNLGLNPSIEALESYGNTAAGLGKDLNQFIEAVADASTNEFERLKEFGIKAKQQGDQVSFTFQGVTTTVQKNAAQIQEYLLNLGDTKFAGALEAQANTFNGAIIILKNNLKILFKDFGDSIIEYIQPLIGYIKDLVVRFRELSPETKKLIVVLGAIAAAVGPLLALAGTILPAIGTGLTLLSGPIGLVVAGLVAIGIAVSRNLEPITNAILGLVQDFEDLYKEAIAFRIAVEAVTLSFRTMYEIGRFIVNALGSLFKSLGSLIQVLFTNLSDIVEVVFTDIRKLPEALQKATREGLAVGGQLFDSLKEDFTLLKTNTEINLKQGIADALQGNKFDNLTADVKKAVGIGVKEGLVDNNTPSQGIDLTPKLSKIDVPGINAGLDKVDFGDVELISNKTVSDFEVKLAVMQSELADFNEATRNILEKSAQNFVSGFGSIIGSIASGASGVADFGGFLLGSLGQVLIDLGELAITTAVTIEAINTALKSLNPYVAVVAGIAAIALGTLIKNQASSFAGSYANGGIVGGNSFYGDKNLVRVNSGELILNLAQQKNLAGALGGGGNITLLPSIDVSGDKLRILLKRTDNKRARLT